MDRRKFIGMTAKGVAGGLLAIPAIAHANDVIVQDGDIFDHGQYTITLPPAEAGRIITIVNTGEKWVEIFSG